MELGIILAGFIVGTIVTLTGMAGGAIMTPTLILGFGIPPAIAVGTDLIYAALTKGGALWTYARRGLVSWNITRWLLTGSLPAAAITLLVLWQIKDHNALYGGLITVTLSIALALTGAAVLLRERLRVPHTEDQERHPADQPAHKRRTLIAGAILGVLVTLTSVGSGALGIALLLFFYPLLATRSIVATDLAQAVPLIMVAGVGHIFLGNVDFHLLANLLLGAVPGILLGARLASHVPGSVLRKTLGLLLIVIGVRLAI